MSAWEDSAQAEVRVPVLLSDSDAGEFEFPELEDAEKLQASHTGAESGLLSDKKASSEPDDEAQVFWPGRPHAAPVHTGGCPLHFQHFPMCQFPTDKHARPDA